MVMQRFIYGTNNMVKLKLDFDADKFTELFAFLMSQELQKAAPKDTGRMARSFPGTLKVSNNNISFLLPEYTLFVEYGTPPHVILPKTKKALNWRGAEHPVKKVNHPGTRPNPFIRNTLNNKTKDVLLKTFDILNK